MEISFINAMGVALDNFLREMRDEAGKLIIVPIEDQHLYDIIFKTN